MNSCQVYAIDLTEAAKLEKLLSTPNRDDAQVQEAARKVPGFIEPELCKLVERPPDGEDWAHEAKLDGYRMQLRVAAHEATLKTRKGLDWTDKFQPLAAAAAKLPDCIIDSEVAALDANGAPDFGALQAALSEGDVDDLVLFAFDLLFLDGKSAQATAARAQGAVEEAAAIATLRRKEPDPLRRSLRSARQRRARIGVSHEPRRHHLEAPRFAVPCGPRR